MHLIKVSILGKGSYEFSLWSGLMLVGWEREKCWKISHPFLGTVHYGHSGRVRNFKSQNLSCWHSLADKRTCMIWNIISSNLIHHLFIDQWGQLSELNTINWHDTTHFHSEGNYHTGCRNVSHCQQHSYLGLQSPAQLYSIYSWSTLGGGGGGWVGGYVCL